MEFKRSRYMCLRTSFYCDLGGYPGLLKEPSSQGPCYSDISALLSSYLSALYLLSL